MKTSCKIDRMQTVICLRSYHIFTSCFPAVSSNLRILGPCNFPLGGRADYRHLKALWSLAALMVFIKWCSARDMVQHGGV